MTKILRVRWTLLPERPPEPWLPCPACRTLRPFRSSGRIRLNANGRRLDAWLIYRCTSCDRTWNRPIFERRPVREVPPAVLAGLEASDPAQVRAVAFDISGLQRRARRIESFGAGLRAERLDDPTDRVADGMADGVADGMADWAVLRIAIRVPEPVGLRLDRLLAGRFGLSRARIERLFLSGRIQIEAGALRRPVADGCAVILVPEAAERALWEARALGGP